MTHLPQVPPTQPGLVLRPHRGGMILALGILSIVLCFLCGIFAWVMANNDLREMAQGRMDPSGRGSTQAGKICGIIGTVLGSLAVLWSLFWMIVFGGLLVAGAAAGAAGAGNGP